MKKVIGMILSYVLLMSTTACGSTADTSADSTAASTNEQTGSDSSADESSAASDENKTDGSNVLVVYYSASGNTERVAKDIANAAGADIFEIVPTEIYTDADLNWTDPDSRVSREHDDESLRDVPLTETTVENWDSYDTVFIGYPIWWAIAAWPVDNFVKDNDFTGKTVIPFATSASSGMGKSGELLAEMAGSGDWQEGQRFSSGASADDAEAWVRKLGL